MSDSYNKSQKLFLVYAKIDMILDFCVNFYLRITISLFTFINSKWKFMKKPDYMKHGEDKLRLATVMT